MIRLTAWLPLVACAAQAATYPLCSPSAPIQTIIEDTRQAEELGLDGPETIAEKLRILTEARRSHPNDFFLERAYAKLLRQRTLAAQQEDEAAARSAAADPAERYLHAETLIGYRSAEAARILEELLAQHPAFPWPHLALAELRSYPAFLDHAGMRNHALNFLRLCPESLDAYPFLRRATGPELVTAARTLRATLKGRTDHAAIRAYPSLWELEFETTPPAEHDNLRKSIAADVDAIRLQAGSDRAAVRAVAQGAKLTGNSALEKQSQERLRELVPVRTRVMEERNAWFRANPPPSPDAPPEAQAAHRQARLRKIEELLQIDPRFFWLWWEKLGVLADVEATPTSDLTAAGERALEIAQQREATGLSTPAELLVGEVWARRGVNRRQLDAMAERGLALAARQERNNRTSDLFPPETRESEQDGFRWLQRLDAFTPAVRIYLTLGELAKARNVLMRIEDTLRDARTAPFKDGARRQFLHGLPVREFSYFSLMAELASKEGRKPDALAFHASALRASHAAPGGGERVRQRAAPGVRALWNEMGGTGEGWQLWLEQTQPPEPPAKRPAPAPIREPLPAFTARDLEGNSRTRDDLLGGLTFVNVWATWCQPCRAELPAVQKLHETGRVRVVTWNTDRNTGLVAPFVSENNFRFPVWMARPVFESLRPMGGVPVSWFVDANGTIVWEQRGYTAPDADTWVKEMLARATDLARAAQ